MMKLEEVLTLIKAVSESELTEVKIDIEMKRETGHLRLQRTERAMERCRWRLFLPRIRSSRDFMVCLCLPSRQ